MNDMPVACNLSEAALAERRTGLLADLRGHRQEVRWLQDGAAFRYLATPDILGAVTEFIRLESQCCPFLRFRLTVEPGGGPVWLELTGPPGTREFLEAEVARPA